MRWRLVLGAAGGIALVTVAARTVGFGRTAVLSRTLGTSCVGDVYTAANAVPNVVFEVVAGGALAAVVVPLVAGAVAAGDRDTASRTTSALLTWTVLLLVPVTLLGLLLAPVLVRGLLGGSACPGAVETGTRMLLVFLPQVVLYGVGIVVAGVLQAHRRFLGPALAPLLSSLVVVTAYLLYAASGPVDDAPSLSRGQELLLSAGTTAGVAVLSLGLLVPLRRTGLQLRPTLRFPGDGARRARALAAGGVAGLLAQQVALVVSLRLAAGRDEGSVVVLTVATALFLLPWAVLAVPVATSAFPALSAATGEEYARVLRGALRPVLLAMTGAAVLLAVAAGPLALLLVSGVPGAGRTGDLSSAVVAFAPGLVGYGLLALLSRALYARGDARTPAVATTVGWLVVAAVDVALVLSLPDVDVVVLLGIGSSAGLTLAGLLVLVGLRRALGPGALTGTGRPALVGAAGAAVAGAGAALVPGDGLLPGLVATVVAAAGFLAVVRVLDPAGLRELARA